MIYLLFGKSGVGKTTIYKRLVEDEDLDLTPIITCTTRPPREGEVNEIDYYFISEEEFKSLEDAGELMESTSYTVANGETWYYGTLLKDFTDDKDKIVIVNPDGIKAITEKCKEYDIKTTAILLTSQDSKRKDRLMKRGDSEDEIKRRIKADNKDFVAVDKYAHHKVDTTRLSIDLSTNKVKKIIERERAYK